MAPPAERSPEDWLGPAGVGVALLAWLIAEAVLPALAASWAGAGTDLPGFTRAWLERGHWAWVLAFASAGVTVVLPRSPPTSPWRGRLRLAQWALAVAGVLVLAAFLVAAVLPVLLAPETVG